MKDPLPIDVFPRLVQALGGPEAGIDKLRFLVLSLVDYAGFMRVGELLKAKLIFFSDACGYFGAEKGERPV